MSKWKWLLKRITSKLWVRATLFCLIGIFTALVALLLRDYIPHYISRKIGADAVDSILSIIASSMLAVTTFSLSTMVAAYSAASNSATPRATKLLLEDSTAQNALSVFIGSFLFSLVGIIALHTGLYGESGRIVLFVVTLIVIFVIIVMLIQWIGHLSKLGRMGRTIEMVEKATSGTIVQELNLPNLGGTPVEKLEVRTDWHVVLSPVIGYVQYIDMQKLSDFADEHGLKVYIQAMPGYFNNSCVPIAYTDNKISEQEHKVFLHAFHIAQSRSFDQDVRFGMVVLSEIASRALSPAVNDPGTAKDVISTSIRILAPWLRQKRYAGKIPYPRIHVQNIHIADLLNDFFTPIARDSAGLIEVCIYVQKALSTLAEMGNAECRKYAALHSRLALQRAELALTLDEDKKIVQELAIK